MPDLPNPHASAMLVMTLIALYGFSRDNWRLEITSLSLLVVLVVGFTLFPFADFNPSRLFSGFANEALIAVCALMVLGQGLVQTGALEPIGRGLSILWGKSPALSLLATLITGACLSAFVNNTPIVVLFVPILISVCLRNKSSSSKILMPMGFATLVGGMTTTIGTSTNLLVVNVAADLGLERFGLFDFAIPASVGACVGLAYLWLVAPRLLPARATKLSADSPRLFDARLHLTDDAVAVGKTLSAAIALTGGDMRVIRIRRGDTTLMPLPDIELQVNDRLRVRDTPKNLKAFEESLKAKLFATTANTKEAHPLNAEDQTLAEIAIVRGSRLDRANLAYSQFLDRYQLAVLALHRSGKKIWRSKEDIHDVILSPGDVLLVQGPRDQLAVIKRSPEFLLLDSSVALPPLQKSPTCIRHTHHGSHPGRIGNHAHRRRRDRRLLSNAPHALRNHKQCTGRHQSIGLFYCRGQPRSGLGITGNRRNPIFNRAVFIRHTKCLAPNCIICTDVVAGISDKRRFQ